MYGVCQEEKLQFIPVYWMLPKILMDLAAVMGHEIAHAVAKYPVERMSAAMAVNVTTQIADIFTVAKYLNKKYCW